jgi:hypothetical protein
MRITKGRGEEMEGKEGKKEGNAAGVEYQGGHVEEKGITQT